MQQEPFRLGKRTSYHECDFVVSECNRSAFGAITSGDNWPDGRQMLVGPSGSGKTHLACIWAARNSATMVQAREIGSRRIPHDARCAVIEDIHLAVGDRLCENRLFETLNRFSETGGQLLMTGTGRPVHWMTTLPDLHSRLAGTGMVTIELPDDSMLEFLFAKHFSDRQIVLRPALIRYISARCDRSYTAIMKAVSDLDRMSLAHRRKITRPLAEEYFARHVKRQE